MVRLTKQKKQLNEAIMAINTFFTAQILFENVPTDTQLLDKWNCHYLRPSS